jgi:hypothetical protein
MAKCYGHVLQCMEHFLRVSIFGLISKLNRCGGEQDRLKIDKLHRSKKKWMSACDESMFRPAVLQAATSEQLSINKADSTSSHSFAILKTPVRKIVSRSPKSLKSLERSDAMTNARQHNRILLNMQQSLLAVVSKGGRTLLVRMSLALLLSRRPPSCRRKTLSRWLAVPFR